MSKTENTEGQTELSLLDIQPGIVDLPINFPDGSGFCGLTIHLRPYFDPAVQAAVKKAKAEAFDTGATQSEANEIGGEVGIAECIVGWTFEKGHKNSLGQTFSFPEYTRGEAIRLSRRKDVDWLLDPIMKKIFQREAFYRVSR